MNNDKPKVGDYCKLKQFIFTKNNLKYCESCFIKCKHSGVKELDYLLKRGKL